MKTEETTDDKTIENPSNSVGICPSIHFLNNSFPFSEKTILVFGCGRGGTSAVAGVLRILGVFMPNAHPLKHESSPISYEGSRVNREATRRSIENFNLKYPIWGWKAPKDVFCLDQYIDMIRNPHIIIVFRNILDVIDSTCRHEKIDFVASAIEVADVYKELCKRLTFTCLPVALINYERMCNNPMETVSEIDRWVKADSTKDTLESAANFTKVEGRQYKAVDRDNSAGLSFGSGELALDQANAQLTVYGKRIPQLSSFHAALGEDLNAAHKIKEHLQNKIAELSPEEDLSQQTTGIEVYRVFSKTEVSVLDYELNEDINLDDLVHRAKSAEDTYYQIKKQYQAVLRERMEIQKVIDDLAAKLKLLENNQL